MSNPWTEVAGVAVENLEQDIANVAAREIAENLFCVTLRVFFLLFMDARDFRSVVFFFSIYGCT
jgi:hypothetical protein